MKDYMEFLKNAALFKGISPVELPEILKCLNARTASYKKQDIILMEGQPVSCVGIVLSGRVQILKEDYMGNRNILTEISPGNLFAETYSCVRINHLPITAVCISDGEILWVDYQRIVSTCSTACPFHTKLIENMLLILASKNLLLSQKIEHISRRTTRDKLLAYLSDQATQRAAHEFDIPFNRQELADYLCVDRSAMSNELSKLHKEGILEFRQNHFLLK